MSELAREALTTLPTVVDVSRLHAGLFSKRWEVTVHDDLMVYYTGKFWTKRAAKEAAFAEAEDVARAKSG